MLDESENFVRLGECNQMVIRTRDFIRRARDVNPMIHFVDKSDVRLLTSPARQLVPLKSGPVNY